MQSPLMVSGLALLFTLIALNLWGLFSLDRLMPASLGHLGSRHRGWDAFLAGVLAVAVATPCTAPGLGAALGFALAFVFGAVAQRTHFCTMGAVADAVAFGDWSRARMWALAVATAMLGFKVGWTLPKMVLVMLAGCVPFLSFWVERRVAGEVEERLASARQ